MLEVVRSDGLADFVEVESKAGDFADYLVDLIFHLALSNSHSVDQNGIVDLLLPDAFVVAFKIGLLGLVMIGSGLESLDLFLPAQPSLLLPLQLSLKVFHLA